MQHVINLDGKPTGVEVTPAPLFEKPMFPFSMVPTPAIALAPLPGFSFLSIHDGIHCDKCATVPIRGIRYKVTIRYRYNI